MDGEIASHLEAELEDARASLAAALARIEVFRVREKAVVLENTQMRNQLYGGNAAGEQAAGPACDSKDPQKPVPYTRAPDAPSRPAGDKPGSSTTPAGAPVKIPCYITEFQGQVPVQLTGSSGRKVPGSIIVNKDYIDFVEVRAHIKQDEFLGFTTASAFSTPYASGSPKFKLFPSCLGQLPVDEEDEAAAGPGSGFVDSPRSGDGPSGIYTNSLGQRGAGNGSRRHSWNGNARQTRSGPGSSPTRANPPIGSGDAPWHPDPAGPMHRDDSISGTAGGGGGGGGGANGGGGGTGTWQILWKAGDAPQQLVFQATQETRQLLHRHTNKWLGEGDTEDEEPSTSGLTFELCEPRHLSCPSQSRLPRMSEPSTVLSPSQVGALVAAMPQRFQHNSWNLLYSTARHGISLHTLFRKAAGAAPSLLVIRDSGGYLFGSFAPEPWRVAPRFYGTGETFVYQLEPHQVMYPWKSRSQEKNDYFMYGTPECLAVGGTGHFAIWMDSELLHGNSDTCGTFGSPCLSNKEEFRVMAVELWHVGA